VDKGLQDAQIKLSDVVSDLFGMSGRAMLDALVAGERNPRTLADLAKGTLVKKKPALIEALTGQFEDHHARLLRVLLGTVDHLTAQLRRGARWSRSGKVATALRVGAVVGQLLSRTALSHRICTGISR
jgi:hypothetical protein